MKYEIKKNIGNYLSLMKGTMEGILTMERDIGEPLCFEDKRYSFGNGKCRFSKDSPKISKKERTISLDKKLLD